MFLIPSSFALPGAGRSGCAGALLAVGVLSSFGCASRLATRQPASCPAAQVAQVADGFAGLEGGTTGGAAGRTVTAGTLAELKAYAESAEPLVIRIAGTISGGEEGASIRVASDKTLLGVGTDGFLPGVGLNISSRHNVIVRNLRFTMSTVTRTAINDESRPQVVANDGDCIRLQGSSHHVWVDHCEFFNLDPARQPNQDLYDGLVDVKDQATLVTVSWCYFHDHHKCHLLGSSDKDAFDRQVTFHHNRYDNIKERVPSYRYGHGHVFNNLYHHVTGSGVNARMGACLRVEANVFEDVRDPVTSKNSPEAGTWSVADNRYDNCRGSQPTAGTCTWQPPYTAPLTPVAEVRATVLQGAGIGHLGQL